MQGYADNQHAPRGVCEIGCLGLLRRKHDKVRPTDRFPIHGVLVQNLHDAGNHVIR